MLTGLEVPIFALSHELAKLGTRVQKKSGDATRWVVKRQRARVDVIAGYGLDIDSKTSVPFVAIEYHLSFRMQARIRRHPALKGTSATEVLAQDVSRVLMGQGLLQLDAVVAWPDILNGHSKRDGSELY
jgi:hypothetical protein